MSQQLEMLAEIPSQWNPLMLITHEIQKKEIKPFVLLALKELEHAPDDRISSLLSVEKFSAIREVVRHFARCRPALQGPWAAEDVRAFLEGLRFAPECVTELATLLCTDRIYESLPRDLRLKPALVSLSWKIDVSLSQASLSSGARFVSLTHVILRLSLSDGHRRTYRLSVPRFHALRFVVASALKALLVLERRKCMRGD